MRSVTLILLVIVSFVMIFFGIQNELLPPALTGLGFLLIAILFVVKPRNKQ